MASIKLLSAADRNRLAERMRAEYGTPRQIAPSPPGSDRHAFALKSAVVPAAEEPILNLHHPDLPWRLEDPPTPTPERTTTQTDAAAATLLRRITETTWLRNSCTRIGSWPISQSVAIGRKSQRSRRRLRN